MVGVLMMGTDRMKRIILVMFFLVCLSLVSTKGAVVQNSTGNISMIYNSGWFPLEFMDLFAPEVLSVSVNPDVLSAIVTVTMNKSASLTIRYGTSAASLGTVVSTSLYQNPNSVQLSPLLASTTYYFNITACAPYGGQCIVNNGTYVFTTDAALPAYQCSDSINNDADNWTDYPDDPGCSSPTDNDESDNPECSDGVDNDGDGYIDYSNDTGCTSIFDDDESESSGTTPTGTTGSTGGGGAFNGTGATKGEYSRFWDKIGPGSIEFLINSNDLPLTKLEIDLNKEVSSVSLKINRKNSFPAGASAVTSISAGAISYQIFEITEDFPKSAVDKVKYYFKVKRSWADDNGIKISDIALYKLSNGAWEKKSTTYIGNMDDYYLFESTSSGFSIYMIAGVTASKAPVIKRDDKNPPVVNKTTTPVVTPKGEEPKEEEPIITSSTEQEQNFFAQYGTILMVFAVPIIILISIFTIKGLKSNNVKTLTTQYYVDTEPENFMRIANGWVVRNIYDLHNAVAQLDDKTFSMHVNGEKNDFSSWVANTFNDTGFAMDLKSVRTKDEMAMLLSDKIQFLQAKQKEIDVSHKFGIEKVTYRQLLDYINAARSRGLTNHQIHKNLLIAKWRRDIVDHAVYAGNKPMPIPPETGVTEGRYRILQDYVEKEKVFGVDPNEIHTNVMGSSWKDAAIVETMYGMTQKINKPKHLVNEDDKIILNRYLLAAVNRGMTRDEILQNLLKAGWSLQVIESEISNFMTNDGRYKDFINKS
ncbi:hypothetical protein COV93_05080 [Candidatus Woesearchaeota archaeon CG11_big_fil_rev_8_21_14_0_20_43_8]|nr:MAG: hypothetical protein COV93_05080 [Candidatus Woesearchaeota archaeon CG11_big_fil_rev_8_21_14_0_20_43_8]